MRTAATLLLLLPAVYFGYFAFFGAALALWSGFDLFEGLALLYVLPLIGLTLLHLAAAWSMARNRNHKMVMAVGGIGSCLGIALAVRSFMDGFPHVEMWQALPGFGAFLGGGFVFWVARTAKRQKLAEALWKQVP